MTLQDKFEALSNVIGNTPMLEINMKYKGAPLSIYVKAEYYNLTGSIKDRMAFYTLKEAYRKGTLKEGDVIAEATSGNTGISFAALGRCLGHEVVICMPDWMSSERKNIISGYGATIKLVSREEGGFLRSIEMTREMAEKGGVFLPCQFSNPDNIMAHYTSTGPEIIRQLEEFGKKPDAVVAGVGTGGTIMGIGTYLRDKVPSCKIHPLEPANSPTLSTGHKIGHHRIQGISDDFIPENVRLAEIDEVVAADDGDAITIAQMLSKVLGLGVGISSGANLIGAIKVALQLGEGSTVVTIFADDNKKYLSTDYVKEQPRECMEISKDVELLSFRALR